MEINPRKVLLLILITLRHLYAFEAHEVPQIPLGTRSQFLVVNDDGTYNYGYDTASNSFARQSATAANEVEGEYGYKDANGQDIEIKYTSGVQGFVPIEIYPTAVPVLPASQVYSLPAPVYEQSISSQRTSTPDGHLGIPVLSNTVNQPTLESNRNIQTSAWYIRDAARDNSGYTTQRGFPATNDGLTTASVTEKMSTTNNIPSASSNSAQPCDEATNTDSKSMYQQDGSLDTKNQSQESSITATLGAGLQQTIHLQIPSMLNRTTSTNTPGGFSYTTPLPIFQSTAAPLNTVPENFKANGFEHREISSSTGQGLTTRFRGSSGAQGSFLNQKNPVANELVGQILIISSTPQPFDASYDIGFNPNVYEHQLSSAPQENIREGHFYAVDDPVRDVAYDAGSQAGFQSTGSLSILNGPQNQIPHSVNIIPSQQTIALEDDFPNTGDASYDFEFETDTYQRKESSDPHGEVQGSYSYKNGNDTYDLTFVAGAKTGFQPTGGVLSIPNGLVGKIIPSTADLVYSTSQPEYDSRINIRQNDIYRGSTTFASTIDDSYSFINRQNTDFTYAAGSEKNFVTTENISKTESEGQSVTPTPSTSETQAPASNASSDQESDDFYNFSIDTGDYQRKEKKDSNGNVEGSYSYRDKDGTHSLNYKAGSKTGFVVTGGSLLNSFNPSEDSNYFLPSEDGNYKFSVDTPEYQEQVFVEYLDVKGAYSDSKGVIEQDLAGAETITGPESRGRDSKENSTQEAAEILPEGHETSKVEGQALKTFGPTKTERKKFGYIFEMKTKNKTQTD